MGVKHSIVEVQLADQPLEVDANLAADVVFQGLIEEDVRHVAQQLKHMGSLQLVFGNYAEVLVEA